MVWKDKAELNVVKAHLQMARSFSFVGAYTETNRDHVGAD